MPRVALKVGLGELTVDLPDSQGFQGVLRADEPPPLPDSASQASLSLAEPCTGPPLCELARGCRSACIVVSDATRPVPNPVLLAPILAALLAAGLPRESITLLIATGMHEPSTQAQRERLLGTEIARSFAVFDHCARDEQGLVEVGTLAGDVPLRIDRRYASADLKILTGLIEPHMWAGYSGGRKSILPGIASLETLRTLHGPAMVAHPRTRSGLLEGNPFHEAALEALALAGADFLVNVTVDRQRHVTGIFAGDPVRAHLEGCRFLAEHCRCTVPEPLDFVLTTNGGLPLDCNLYQASKGITGAETIVRPGGTILLAAACGDGLGSAAFRAVVERIDEPGVFLARLHRGELFMPDQWCAQAILQVAQGREVWVRSAGVSATDVAPLGLRWVAELEGALASLLERYGADARWAVVPDGPWVVLEPGW